jgi:hypothetical protein
MKRMLLTAAAAALVTAAGTAGAFAANIAPNPPGVPVYGELPGTPPADFPPPTVAPAGFHYEWRYGYDHMIYKGHWAPVRN